MDGWRVRSGFHGWGIYFATSYAPRLLFCTILAFEGGSEMTCHCCCWRGNPLGV